MKVKAPFIGFASPNPTFSVWHLFARVGSKFQHIAFMVIGSNRWNEPPASYPVRGDVPREYSCYPEEDLQRWSEFRP